jgi:hypothetical protein
MSIARVEDIQRLWAAGDVTFKIVRGIHDERAGSLRHLEAANKPSLRLESEHAPEFHRCAID